MPHTSYPSTPYHAQILIEHFAQKLQELGVPIAAPIAVLTWLWLKVGAYSAETVACVDVDSMLALVPNSGVRSRQRWLAQLTKIGAVKRDRFGLRLLRPDVAVLSPEVRLYLREPWAFAPVETTALAVVDGAGALAKASPTTATTPADPPANEVEARRAAKLKRQQQGEHLAQLGKSRSDVRDVLARLGRLANPNTLRYSGKGSAPVAAAVAWLHETSSDWGGFMNVCKACARDKSPDKPERPHELFYDAHREYLTRLCADLSSKEAP